MYSLWLTILAALRLALEALAAAFKVLLWDSRLPCMTQHRLAVVLVHLMAPAASMAMAVAVATAVALSGRDHCCQQLPQPVIGVLHSLHQVTLTGA